jgi:predicted transcriptional regulator
MDNSNQQVNSQVPNNQIRLVDVQVTDENVALNLIVSFVTLAHKRGVFSLDESAKIWECIKIFDKPDN